MKRDPYRDQANKSRQEIKTAANPESVQTETKEEISRLELHGKKREEKSAQKKPFPLIRVLLGLFVLLPLTVLAITFFSNDNDVLNATVEKNNSVQVEQSERENNTKQEPVEKEKEESVPPAEEKEESEEEPVEQEAASSEEPEEVVAEDSEESMPAEETEETPAEEPAAEEVSTTTHTVQANETLYRISVNYLGHGDGVEKIKQLNGLTSNEISEGQVLKIPSP